MGVPEGRGKNALQGEESWILTLILVALDKSKALPSPILRLLIYKLRTLDQKVMYVINNLFTYTRHLAKR